MTKTTAPVFSDIQKVNPSSIIELFKLELKEGLNYATGNPSNVTTVHRFHSGSNLDAYENIVWNGENYSNLRQQHIKDRSKISPCNKCTLI